ncbi:MAG: GNAT family N-acetyltransferase [Hyphomonadaceae bacterium]|nr:GNAT family N-acetyltransferase [Hyphomonadaceae bacterium]
MSGFETVKLERLGAADAADWAALCRTVPEFGTPLLSPEFARIVSQFRPDTRVALQRDGHGRAIAFFPHSLRPDGLARPLGAPFGDYQGVIAAPCTPVDLPGLMASAGIRRFAYGGLLDPANRFAASQMCHDTSYRIVLENGAATYLDALQAENPKRHKNWRRLQNKTEREVGAISFNPDQRDSAILDMLLGWKADQMVRTGITNVLAPAWVRSMMHALLETRQGTGPDAFGGLMMTLHAGDTLLAGHFGVRLGGTFHPWMAAINPDFHAQSPGQTYLFKAISAMEEVGLTTYDLGLGHSHYKAPFCNVEVRVGSGLWLAQGARAPMSTRSDLMGRLARRIDHVASVELDMAGRLRGVAQAFVSAGTRMRSRGQDQANEIGA